MKYTVINSVSLAKYIPCPIRMAVGKEALLITTLRVYLYISHCRTSRFIICDLKVKKYIFEDTRM